MHRTRQHAVIVLVLAGAVLAPSAAYGYHAGKLFDRASGGGGAGGLFYTGSRRDRGWDCTACHVDSPGRLRVDVTSQPPELLSQNVYTPGTTYTITVAMVDPGSQLGIASTRSNFNGIAISTLDADGAPAGAIGGFDSGSFHTHGLAILATDTFTVNETSWRFSWTAPADAAGPIAIDLGVVDGDGAGQAGTTTLTDPMGDDVVMLHYVVSDGGTRAERVRPRDRTIRGTSPSDTRPAAALRCRRCRRRARRRGSRRPSRGSHRCR
jgi:hypothetical protein